MKVLLIIIHYDPQKLSDSGGNVTDLVQRNSGGVVHGNLLWAFYKHQAMIYTKEVKLSFIVQINIFE